MPLESGWTKIDEARQKPAGFTCLLKGLYIV